MGPIKTRIFSTQFYNFTCLSKTLISFFDSYPVYISYIHFIKIARCKRTQLELHLAVEAIRAIDLNVAYESSVRLHIHSAQIVGMDEKALPIKIILSQNLIEIIIASARN